MKVISELPISILKSIYLLSIPAGNLRKQPKETTPVIVSLTSIPSRLNTLHLVIRSLLVQDAAPEKIVLWLHKDLEHKLPLSITKLVCHRFEIRYSPYTSSHRKLIHALEAFPDDVIITCDDDLMYRKNWVSVFYDEHRKNPENVIGNRTVHINHNVEGDPISFRKWRYPADENAVNPMAITPIGAWGVLYPPHSLSDKVQDAGLFLELAPRADDLWFKAMALLKGTVSIQASHFPKEPIPIGNTQKEALKKENLGADKNTVQWQALEDRFGLSRIILGANANPEG